MENLNRKGSYYVAPEILIAAEESVVFSFAFWMFDQLFFKFSYLPQSLEILIGIGGDATAIVRISFLKGLY